ncbi:hypothetical protein ACQPZG_13155 [Streptomyces sp. CA-294286]
MRERTLRARVLARSVEFEEAGAARRPEDVEAVPRVPVLRTGGEVIGGA